MDKSAIAVGAERNEAFKATKTQTQIPGSPESITAKVLSEADLKNIFTK